jgi:hypothetical protein
MFSAFTGWGFLAFSSAPPRGQSIYEAIVSMNGGNFDDTFAGPMCAEWYATAMAIARARDTLERAENQADPLAVHEMLPVQEGMYGLAPGPTDSANDRRATLAARYAVALEPSQQNVTRALRVLLGDDFVAWVPNLVASPSPASIPAAQCKPANARFKTIILQGFVVGDNTQQRVAFRHEDGDSAELQDREVVVIDPGLSGIEEAVTVLGPPLGGMFVAQFAMTHAAGARGITSSFPNWSSFKKNSLVVVKRGRAHDPVLRAKVSDLLSRMLSGTSTWDVVQENVIAGTAGPLLVGQPGIGTVPIGLTTYVTL